MTTAYDGEPGLGVDGLDEIPYLPISTQLKSGSKVEVSPFREEEWQIGMNLMNLIIREGRAWPFENEFDSMDAYRGYFLSHAAFVVRALEPGVDGALLPKLGLGGLEVLRLRLDLPVTPANLLPRFGEIFLLLLLEEYTESMDPAC